MLVCVCVPTTHDNGEKENQRRQEFNTAVGSVKRPQAKPNSDAPARRAAARSAASQFGLENWNASSGMGKVPEVACEARVADGIFRGGALGLLWAVWFGPSECWGVQQPFRHNALQLSKRTGMYVLGFSSFLACYNGLFCGCERSFGRDSAASPVAAGGLVGLAVGAMIPPVRVATMLSTAGMCAGLCGAGHAMGAVWRT